VAVVTALLTGTGIGVFARAVTTYVKQTCAAPSANDPGSMCEPAVIFWARQSPRARRCSPAS
jgi:hypothetical protein